MKKALVTFMVALFATVVLGQATKTDVKPSDLPDCVTKYIHQNMNGYTIDKVYRIENKLDITYEVTLIMKGKEKQVLTFDANCKVVKKIIPNEKKKPEPKPVPPVKNPQTGVEKNVTVPKK